MKKVIVTGGCGYIGSHIVKALKLSGEYDITVIDLVRRDHTLVNSNHYIQADFDSEEVYTYLKRWLPDAIVHCAAYIKVGESVYDPARYYANNVTKSANFFAQVCNLKKLPVVVFSSSAAVYGNPTVIPVTEDAPILPINPYGHTKAMIEQILTDYGTAYRLKSACLRYFNASGADPFEYKLGQEPDATHIIARLLEAKYHNGTFDLHGTDYNTPDGTCVRDYVHVWDLAVAHIKAIEYLLYTGKSVKLNLGTNIGHSNREIINECINRTGFIVIHEGPRRPGDPDILVADASRARDLLNWTPIYSDLYTIVNSAWQWMHYTK